MEADVDRQGGEDGEDGWKDKTTEKYVGTARDTSVFFLCISLLSDLSGA